MLAGWKFSNFKDGVFAEFFHVNEADANMAHLPADVDPVAAVMLADMVPTGFHGVELADVQFGDDVCVVGIGPVGLMSVAGAALHGAAQLLAVGSRPVCAEAARRYGATEVLNYREGDIVAQVMEKTNGRGVDRVIIAGGDAECTFGEAVKMLKPGGRIGNVNYLGAARMSSSRARNGAAAWATRPSRRPDARRPPAHGEAGRAAADRPPRYPAAHHASLPRL